MYKTEKALRCGYSSFCHI